MRKSVMFFLLAAASALLLFAAPMASSDGYSVSQTFQFSVDDLSFGVFAGYDLVTLADGASLAELGKPMLALKEVRIALPPGMAASSLRVVATTVQQIPGEFNILPGQRPREIGSAASDSAFVEPDVRWYSSSHPYPSSPAELVGETDLAGQAMAVVRLFPLQYVPSQRKLSLCTTITLVVEGSGGYVCRDYLPPTISQRGEIACREMLQDMVVNPQDVRLIAGSMAKGAAGLPSGPFDHVIVTSSTFASGFQQLVNWHNQRGVRDTVVTTSWIYLNYAGADSQKIRSFVADAYSTWGTTYFLLGGENETVPFAYRNYSSDTPSDQYYSDFDDDWTQEVYVGRVSVANSTEISTFVNKVLKYEKYPPRTGYPLDVLLIGMDLDATTFCEDLKENIDFGYIPSRFNLTKVYDSDAGNHRTATLTALNAGQNLVNHADHSNTTVMGTGDYHHGWGIYSSDVDALANDGQLSVIVSLGCDPNHMDYNDCIAEHFVIYNPNQGAVAFTGNTRSGLYYPGDPLSLSGGLDKQWWISLFFWGKHTLGQILADAKNHFPHTDNSQRHCAWTMNLLGEPEMPVWTDEPDSFQVTHPGWIPPETWPFAVHVDDAASGAPASQAYVCLWKEGQVYLTGYTDANGDISFNPSPSTTGSMWVTVTKYNYLPHESPVAVLESMRGDANGDRAIDLADAIYILNYLYKSGPAPDPLDSGDANCDSHVDVGDVVYLLNYLFRDGPEPGCL
jgi:hypothetical protein